MIRILLITHDAVLARAYRARFAREGFDLLWQPTGHAGLVTARDLVPDIILVDVALPGLHGLDVVKSLRDVPRLVKTSVVLLVERTLSRGILNDCLLWSGGSFLEKDHCSLQDVVDHVRALMPADLARKSNAAVSSKLSAATNV